MIVAHRTNIDILQVPISRMKVYAIPRKGFEIRNALDVGFVYRELGVGFQGPDSQDRVSEWHGCRFCSRRIGFRIPRIGFRNGLDVGFVYGELDFGFQGPDFGFSGLDFGMA